MFDHFLVDHVWPPWVSASHCIGLCWTFVQEDMSKHKVSWWNMNNLEYLQKTVLCQCQLSRTSSLQIEMNFGIAKACRHQTSICCTRRLKRLKRSFVNKTSSFVHLPLCIPKAPWWAHGSRHMETVRVLFCAWAVDPKNSTWKAWQFPKYLELLVCFSH